MLYFNTVLSHHYITGKIQCNKNSSSCLSWVNNSHVSAQFLDLVVDDLIDAFRWGKLRMGGSPRTRQGQSLRAGLQVRLEQNVPDNLPAVIMDTDEAGKRLPEVDAPISVKRIS